MLGPKAAAQVIYRKELDEAGNPEELLARKAEEYRQTYSNPFMAAKRGFIDDVINPRDTRHRLIRSLQFLENKQTMRPQRKHGNIPL